MPGGLHPPPDVVLSWQPNYIDPVRRGPGVVVLTGVMLALVYLIVALRLYARGIRAHTLGLDDVLIAINLIFLTGLSISIILTFTIYDGDRHIWDIPFATLLDLRKTAFATIQLYTTTNTLTKVSILLFYRRLTIHALSSAYRWMLISAIWFVLAYFLSFTIALFAGCSPFSAFWRQIDPFWDKDWKCVDEPKVIIAASIISIVQDFICCFMPVILFWKLQIPRSEKVALMAVFGVGFCVCITGILRSIYVQRLYTGTYDASWGQAPIVVTTVLEMDLGVICASLPALYHFSKQVATSDSPIISRIRTMLSNRVTRSNFKKTTSRSGSSEDLRRDPSVGQLDAHHGDIRVVEDIVLHEQYLPHQARTGQSEVVGKTWLEDSSSDNLRHKRYT